MADYSVQVQKSHYGARYRSKDRWLSYLYQVRLVHELAPASVFEVGPGEGVVTDMLRKDRIRVITCDIAEDLGPDIVASVTRIPCAGGVCELALAAEVLEHIRFEDVSQALRELARIASKHVVVSLPHPGWVFSLSCKLPLVPRIDLFFQIPLFWETHVFNGEHYWELGKRGMPVRRFIAEAKNAGLALVATRKYIDDPVHRFFIFRKI